MRFAGVILLMLGLYVGIEWGVLGKNPWQDLGGTAQAATPPAGGNNPPGTASNVWANRVIGATNGGPLPSSLFGVGSVPFNGYGESLPGIRSADQGGLTAIGGGLFAHDMDYAATAGSSIRLPPDPTGQGYTYLGNETGGWGNLIYFKTPNGKGVFGFPHIENLSALQVGTRYAGGTQVGTVGKGPYDPHFWKGVHLSVITDTGALGWFNSLLVGANHG